MLHNRPLQDLWHSVATAFAISAFVCTAHAGGILIDLDDRERVLERLQAGDEQLEAARAALARAAEAAMRVPVRPITEGKENGRRTAPSGDPRDYVSLSPYWWPNPDTEDGTPYIRHDGQVNPERYEYDTPKLGDMGKAVRTLGMAYFITGDERYAERALEHIRPWFVDERTRMNPRVRYAQFVPGVSDGRCVGIIDTNRLRWVPDAMLMLRESPAWTTADTEGTKRWFSEYTDWLLASELGAEERSAENNHGTWYAAQVAYYASYADRDVVVREIVSQIPERIASQIEPDGRQPHELERTMALHYSDFNLRAMLDLCRYAEGVGYDLASFETEDGRSIKNALLWLVPYMTGEKDWEYQQIKPVKPYMFYQCLRVASRQYDEPRFESALEKLPPLPDEMAWVDLLLPPNK
jgi:hypothetical protein